MFRFRSVMAVSLVCALAGSVSAATLLLEYDVNQWNDETSSVANTGILNANTMRPMGDSVFVPGDGSSGGTGGVGAGPLDRAYIDLPLPTDDATPWSYVAGSGRDNWMFAERNSTGFSVVGYFYFSKDMWAEDNTGIGTSHDPSMQCVLLYSNRNNVSFQSWTQMISHDRNGENCESDGRYKKVDYIDDLIPRDEWVMFTKVFDTVTGDIFYYINDELVLTSKFGVPIDGFYSFESRGEEYGACGSGGRRIQGMGVSYMAVYDGLLSLEDVKAHYADLTGVPEPATMSLLALGGLALLRRKR